MNQRLYGIWLGDVMFCFSGEVSETKVDAWAAAIKPLQLSGARPFQSANLRLAELKYPSVSMRRAGRSGERRGLTGRTFEGLALSVEDTWSLLLNYDESQFVNQGVHPGAELSYWSACAKFAVHLMLYGRIAPTTQKSMSGAGRRRGQTLLEPVWGPLLSSEDDRERFVQLASAMPPVGLANIHSSNLSEDDSIIRGQMAVLHSLLTALINHEVRLSIKQVGRKLNPCLADYRRGSSPLSELWWNGMLTAGKPPEIQGNTLEMDELAKEISAVLGDYSMIDMARNEQEVPGTFRLCLRIEAANDREDKGWDYDNPNPMGALWRMSYWCEGVEDPYVLLPAQWVWRYPERHVEIRGRTYENLQGNLLIRLRKAAALCPEIASSILHPAPEEALLRPEEMYSFLSKSLSTLRKHGMTIQMPTNWTREGKRAPSIKLKVSGWSESGGGTEEASQRLGFEQLINYSAEVMLGERSLSIEELAELASSKSPLVLFQDQWIEIDVKEIRQVLKYMKRHEKGMMSFRELMYLTSEEEEASLAGIEVESVEIEGKLSMLAEGNGAAANFSDRTVPSALRGTLRPYQERGYRWLAAMRDLGFGALLADDMGLGKTVQVITTLLDGLDKTDNPGLIVCPTSLLGNWQREFAQFAPEMKLYIHHGSGRYRGDQFLMESKKCDVVITTYQLAGRDGEEFRMLEWSSIVLDEAQYIKNYSTKQAQSVMKLSTPHRIAMTGTPVENRLGELWSIFQFLNPGYLGSYTAFRSNYMSMGDNHMSELLRLRKLVSPFLLRRLKSDPMIRKDLPEKMEMKSYCNLTVEQIRMYEEVTSELMLRITHSGGIARKGIVLSSLTKLKQICNHPELAGGTNRRSNREERSGKMERLADLLDLIIDRDEASLIFTQYVQMGEMLQRFISERYGQRPFFLHGGTAKHERDHMVKSFQDGDGSPLFVLSLKAGGVGLNLTRANHVIHYDRWWNPAVENQATDRVFRIGQQRNVEVHKLICQGTLEERIDELIEQKRALSEQVIGSGEQWLTEMSNEELHHLVALQRSSLMEVPE